MADTGVEQSQDATTTSPVQAAVVAAPAQGTVQTQAEPSVGTVVARPEGSGAEVGAIDRDEAQGKVVVQPAEPADDKPATGKNDPKDPDAVVPISAKNPGGRPTDGGSGDWMKLVPPAGASQLTKDLIAATEKAIRFAVDLMGREHTVAPPPEVATLLRNVKADGVGNGQLAETYTKALGKTEQTKTSLLAMDNKVKQTSKVMADDKSKNLAAIKTITAQLKEGMAPYSLVTGKLTRAQDYALMRMVGDALRKICERIVEAADHNWDIAHGGGNNGGGAGGGIPGGGGQQGGGQAGGGGGDGGLGGLLSMLPMLGMIPMSLIPMLPMLTELFNGEGDKQAEDKKAEGGGPPPPPPGEQKSPEGQAAAPGDPNKPAEGATASNDPNKPTGDPAKPQEQKPAEPKDAAAGAA
ncbi:hypothetical protein [Nocardia cyriacigeorgica]|uniref:hypothetical protein n=1 Tax=Nocardia cyriacigeorgica TaxID=135487 RepID=UPI002457F888|nr:hypothetical protein [Nocardia cyriacigeorgica]